jgi:hypothetical protein
MKSSAVCLVCAQLLCSLQCARERHTHRQRTAPVRGPPSARELPRVAPPVHPPPHQSLFKPPRTTPRPRPPSPSAPCSAPMPKHKTARLLDGEPGRSCQTSFESTAFLCEGFVARACYLCCTLFKRGVYGASSFSACASSSRGFDLAYREGGKLRSECGHVNTARAASIERPKKAMTM